jgi:RNA polymerase sigma-70 factor (ECF subfamily)
MVQHQPDTEELVERASRGDDRARQALLIRHRDRLIRMAAVRLDRCLAARVDPADIVQDAMLEASQDLDDCLRTRPLPFHAWGSSPKSAKTTVGVLCAMLMDRLA